MNLKTLRYVSHALLIFVLLTNCNDNDNSESNNEITFTEGLDKPESIKYDTNRNKFYVSNLSENTNGDGFISKLNSDGSIEELKWIQGLDDPKGMAIVNDRLYVADNTLLKEFDINSGNLINSFTSDGIILLNGISPDIINNKLYVTDTFTNSIYILDIASNNFSLLIQNDDLKGPNGVLVDNNNNGLYIASFGNVVNGDFSTAEDSDLLYLNLETNNISNLTNQSIGNLDGIDFSDHNTLYVSDNGEGEIFEISLTDFSFTKFETLPSAADLEVVEDKLYVPYINTGEIKSFF